MNFSGVYEKYKLLPMQELAEIMADREETGSKANIARLVYEERQMAQQHEHDRELIIKQIKAQNRWMKLSIIGVLIAAVIGAIIGSIAQPLVSTLLTKHQQSFQEKTIELQPQQLPSFSTQGHQERKGSISSSQPPIKND